MGSRYIECEKCGYKGVGYRSYISRTELSELFCPACANKRIEKIQKERNDKPLPAPN